MKHQSLSSPAPSLRSPATFLLRVTNRSRATNHRRAISLRRNPASIRSRASRCNRDRVRRASPCNQGSQVVSTSKCPPTDPATSMTSFRKVVSPASSRPWACPPSSKCPISFGSSRDSLAPLWPYWAFRHHRRVRFRAGRRHSFWFSSVLGLAVAAAQIVLGHEDEGRQGMGTPCPHHRRRGFAVARHLWLHQRRRTRSGLGGNWFGFLVSAVAVVLMWLPNSQLWFKAVKGAV